MWSRGGCSSNRTPWSRASTSEQVQAYYAARLFLGARARPAGRFARVLLSAFGFAGAFSGALTVAGARAATFAGRGANSNPTLPSAPRTRNAENGLPLREMNR